MKTWGYLPAYRQMVLIVDCQEIFGQKTCEVWLPQEGRMITVHEGDLAPPPSLSLSEIRYRSLAGRIVQSLNQDVLLAPLEGQIQAMPHQFSVLERVIYGGQGRLLLADEVGLGKTIEAGLVIRELQLRQLVKRILIVTPKGLMQQWKSELWLHFDQDFLIVRGEDVKKNEAQDPQKLWQDHDQVIVSQDSVKPLARRTGWTDEHIAEYNRMRFDALINTSWDLIVIDEAHRLGGSTDYVARFRLGQSLAMSSPYLLLLTATPHQGKSDQFVRLLSLLDPERFIDSLHVTPEDVRPYVIRTAKRKAVALDGTPLFRERRVALVAVDWTSPLYQAHHDLYYAVTDYVTHRYQKAVKAKQFSQAFLLILMQRLVTSSAAAIYRTIERRLAVLEGELPHSEDNSLGINENEEEMDEVNRGAALQGERQHLTHLKDLAQIALNHADARVDRLLHLMDDLRQQESHEIKFLIFTEFLPTQSMLAQILQQAGYKVSILNGQMSLDERMRAQESFRDTSQILVSTDAGGEGLNLQFAYVVINYDLPWNPMKIEQRIGRVDRIGQTHDVLAFNFVLQGTVESRVHEVLLEKLQTILSEMGIDKLGDILDSSGLDFDYQSLFINTLTHPEGSEEYLTQFVNQIRLEAQDTHEQAELMDSPQPDLEKVMQAFRHPFPEWVQWMTEHYVLARGGMVEPRLFGTDLHFPSGEFISGAVFRKHDDLSEVTYLGIHHPLIAPLIRHMPYMTPGEPLVMITSSQFPTGTKGLWSLWRLTLSTWEQDLSQLIAVFVSSQGPLYRTTAQKLWEQMCQKDVQAQITGGRPLTPEKYERCRLAAEEEAASSYRQLMAQHQLFLDRERDKALKAFRIRSSMAQQIGLPQVREFRLKRLSRELEMRQADLKKKEKTIPHLLPLFIVEVDRP